MGDESTSNEKEARFWDLYRTYYAFARTFAGWAAGEHF